MALAALLIAPKRSAEVPARQTTEQKESPRWPESDGIILAPDDFLDDRSPFFRGWSKNTGGAFLVLARTLAMALCAWDWLFPQWMPSVAPGLRSPVPGPHPEHKQSESGKRTGFSRPAVFEHWTSVARLPLRCHGMARHGNIGYGSHEKTSPVFL
mmetsp:Transcript_74370/g.151027  ORF Transcript_74370/g.151027 Transcript_74370/m.151027 type:complete len:155 (-) Transcript_74370:188-652(-)|eukprot:CAMPEP_0201128314 /NCGR_PEP_ID=MMETSP0850-20130426/33323_1 /ASSEMBLY_ACC=CAM_ASM_000622 /TAXON_ID=183588 /ORGANISM="Pseudo-nitzschia fraudulenta, Strain WWA7" /LENGTH=154 /DNA_ID=CAMNT_0047397459 /DNA_START=660 /DNA_END=1124 /DNA_ORIENTATION=+